VPTVDDLADSIAMWGDPDITRHIGGKPFTAEETWGRLLRYIGHWQVLGYGTWIVRDKAGGFVGEVGFFDLHREITPALDIPEVGWVLARAAHGKGYATEAINAILAWGPFERVSCMIDVGNEPSHRVATKCGFHEHARTTYHRTPVIIYRR
jgi:RimJ/RimL family protein N-acetyltransferase